jgi:DNA mismatch endonuclease (patch repair protein)
MQANRRADTKPEVALRRQLHALGYRFRKDLSLTVNGVRARPDVVFTRRKIAIFVDGCFWHCCPEHGRAPTVNTWYWDDKLARNRDRDAKQAAALHAAGWTVLRLWEHECPEPAIGTVLDVLRGQGGGPDGTAHTDT